MSERADHREVAEAAVACSPTGVAALRERLESFDGWLTPERHRVIDAEEDGAAVLCLQLWVRDYSDIADRWEARDAGEPHPPALYAWLKFRSYPQDKPWTELEIAEALSDLHQGAQAVKDSEPLGQSPDPLPPGYDDYDIQDWFMDLRYGFTWQDRPTLTHLPPHGPIAQAPALP